MDNNSLDFLLAPIDSVPGIGEKVAKAFQKIGIYKKIDLLNHFPVRIEKKYFYPDLNLIPDLSRVVLSVEVQNKSGKNGRIVKISTTDGRDEIDVIFFNNVPSFMTNKFAIGAKVTISGKIERIGFGRFKIIHPNVHSSIRDIEKNDIIYPQTAGINSRMIQKYIKYILLNTSPITEWLHLDLLHNKNWLSWYESMNLIHHAEEEKNFDLSSEFVRRLAFDELLASQLAIKIVRKNRSSQILGKQLDQFGILWMNVVKENGYELTKGQKLALAEIEKDQTSTRRMMRLLQGDVGSGKTLVALCAMLNARESHMQSVLMVPTEILAQQHYKNISDLVKSRDVVVEILTGKTPKAKRREILRRLRNFEVHILIGTHALFQPDVDFYNLGLVVIDEQHRFGVNQRMELMNKGDNCDVLVMSATPIPRTLAMSVYGDLDITTIKDKPAGRQPIKTLTISESREDEVIKFMKDKLAKYEQIYWVCPLIESQEDDPEDSFASAKARFMYLQKHFGDEVELLHGKMSVEDKDHAMDLFVRGKKSILVATTVIEVGVNVPNATLLVVEKADKFGLSQLHQLRGRVGRGSKESHCILLFSKNMTATSVSRLKTLKDSEDGFYIAEQDFKLRGGGDILGSKQSGLPNYQIANFEFHSDLLFEAASLANDIVRTNQEASEQYKQLLKLFGYNQASKFLYS